MIRQIVQTIQSIQEAQTVDSNDIKKGWQLVTRIGCNATMEDNKKGNIRSIKTTDDNECYAEIGSIYVWDIIKARPDADSEWVTIKLNPKQEKSKKMFMDIS